MKSSLFFILLLISILSFSQSEGRIFRNKQYPGLSFNFCDGTVIPTNDFVRGENLSGLPIDRYKSVTAKIFWQNPGYTDWQKVYKSPYYGVGFYYGDFNTSEIGNPYSVFGFLGIPALRLKKLEVYSDFEFGIAWHWNHYDPVSNPMNLAIGSGLTVYLNTGLNITYPVTSFMDIGAGFCFTHFSNGGFERPNRGLNLYSPSVELKLYPAGRPDVRSTKSPGRLDRSNDIIFMIEYGDHQLNEHELDTNYFAIGGLGIYYSVQHSNAFRSGPGVDLNFWWGLTANNDGTPGPVGWNNLTAGLIYQPELIIGNLNLTGGIGIYAVSYKYGNFKQLYQRLGVKYYFTQNFSLGVAVRSVNFMLAEYLEFNLGYRIMRGR